MDSRPGWDEYGLALAKAAALRADCTRRQVGAVILDSTHRVIGAGYNGSAPGRLGCLTDNACPRGRAGKDVVPPGSSYDTGAGSCIAVHAEANALLYTDALARRGGTLYCTDEPCDGCLRLLQGSGLKLVVYPDGQKLLS
jgi:dCMP deaminase